MQELTPCPFCGNTPKVVYDDKIAIVCEKCEVTTKKFDNERDASMSWNMNALYEIK